MIRGGRALLTGLVLLLPGAQARPALAVDDAGTQSVFAYGAGNRALGMGSAFVATADDASAMLWNPAGLGRITRCELQAAQSAEMALGFRESYASFVLPSWRWGGAGVSVRHFGAGGIDMRDDRNVVLSEDLSSSNMEVAAGYGRQLGSAWGLGGAVKLQHHRLAGFSSSGLGLDLGMNVRPGLAFGALAPWADRWSLGLAVRNALEPSLRLDRETVPDPTTLRAGIAYRAPLGAIGGVLAEIDIEKARDVSPRFRAGVEYRAHPAAALRMGLDGAFLSAGMGLRWGDLAMDYAFEDNPLQPAHRVGLSVHFGATTEASRLASRKAEDEALARKLAEAFRQRQAQQVAGLLRQAEEALAAGRHDEALEAVTVISTLEPEHGRIRTLERDCLLGKAAAFEIRGELADAAVTYELTLAAMPGDSAAAAGAARCRAEGDRRAARSAQTRELYSLALDDFAAGRLRAARDGFALVLASSPLDADAAAMLQRTEQTIARRVLGLTQQASRHLRAGMPDEAAAALERASALDPAAPALAGPRAALARARVERQAARGPVPSSPPAAPSPGHTPETSRSVQEIEDLYGRGLAAIRAGRSEEALHYFELVWGASPGYREVGEYIKREYLSRGMEAFASGRLEEALTHWERVLVVSPGDERARGYLARAQQQLARSREILGGP